MSLIFCKVRFSIKDKTFVKAEAINVCFMQAQLAFAAVREAKQHNVYNIFQHTVCTEIEESRLLSR